MNENETVRDVCDEIEDLQGAGNGGGAIELYGDEIDARDLSARIIAAHEREMDELNLKHQRSYHALEVHCKKLEDEYLIATNALKPVLACEMSRFGDCTLYGDLMTAVREAQRIAKEGGVV